MNFKTILKELEALKQTKNIVCGSVGVSSCGQDIPYFFVGKKNAEILLVEAGIHAREYITTLTCIELVKYYAKLNLDFGIYFVPMSNPDGIELCLEGVQGKHGNVDFNFLKQVNNDSEDFSQWKANIRAVDLNVNFDALWGQGKHNVSVAMPANYVGKHANSEIETQNLIAFARKIKPNLALCLHSKGNVIYFGFDSLTKQELKRDKFIAKKLQEVSGYKLVKLNESVGGFSDWLSLNFKIPAFTVEVGNDKLKHPIGKEHLFTILNEIKHFPLVAINSLRKFCEKQKNANKIN